MAIASWLTPASKSGTGNKTVGLTASKNPGSSRTTIVTVTVSGIFVYRGFRCQPSWITKRRYRDNKNIFYFETAKTTGNSLYRNRNECCRVDYATALYE